jgi:hypothetical protein
LNRKIALYRRYLRERVAAPHAREYLREIIEAELQLKRSTGCGSDRRE